MNYTSFELEPMGNNRVKSHYGRAYIRKYDDSDIYSLISYGTEVAAGKMATKDSEGVVFRIYDRMFEWCMNGWSATTAKHIESFVAFLGARSYSKKEWVALPYTTIQEVLDMANEKKSA